MADSPVTLENLYAVAGTLAARGIPYAFIGGVAVNAWAVPRATFDLDVTLSVSVERMRELLRALVAAGFVVDPIFEQGWLDQVAGMPKLQVHLPTGATLLTVDIFVASVPFLRSVLERAVDVDLGRGLVRVCTAADLFLFKLLAHRRKDEADIENLVTIQGIPERAYIEHWSTILGVRDRLDQWL